jgi:sec-independent protein translocase protein TatA
MGIGEVILIVAVIVLVFGATQIPKIARSLGEGLKEFKKAVKESKDDKDDASAPEKPAKNKK